MRLCGLCVRAYIISFYNIIKVFNFKPLCYASFRRRRFDGEIDINQYVYSYPSFIPTMINTKRMYALRLLILCVGYSSRRNPR